MLSQMGRLFRLRRLLRDDRGALAAIVGLAIIPLFAAIGLAVDSARGYMLKSKLSYAIDAAGLAGGRAFETDLREEDIMMFFEANFPPGYMSSVLAPGHPIITFNDEENTVTIVASATIPTHFMSVAGVHEMTISARSVIKRELQRHGAGAGHGQHRLDARQRRHGGDEAGRDRSWSTSSTATARPCRTSGSASCRTRPTSTSAPQHDDWLITQAYDEDAAWQNADPDSEIRFGYHRGSLPADDLEGLRRGAPISRATATTTRPTTRAGIPTCGARRCNRFENPAWVDPGDYDGDGDVDTYDAAEYVGGPLQRIQSGDLGAVHSRRQRMESGRARIGPQARQRPLSEPRAPVPISAAARRSRRWSRARARCRRRSTRWRPGIAAAPWPISGSPGAGASSRPAGAAFGTATCPTSCPSTTRRRT